VPSDLIVYPDEGHGFSPHENGDDAYQKMFEFLRKQLK
jgi:dipeptidyl aminopeptidase/acylaminoacyl peptidase